MRQTTLKNRTGWMISAATMVFCLAAGTISSQAADSVVVIPMGNHGAPVAKTGQTTSTMPGDDGALQKGVSVSGRFKDNGNGTVTDGLTGLIWLKEGQCLKFFSEDTTGVNNRPWGFAIDAANNLANSFCNLTDGSKAGDWRLPNLKELESLMDLGQANPVLPIGCPLAASTATTGYYWSSTVYAPDPSKSAWHIHFSNGIVLTDFKTVNSSVRAVRGGQ